MPDYSLGDVARILKVSPRRLRYWQKTELLSTIEADSYEPVIGSDVELEIEGAVDDAEGDDSDEGYAFRDLVVLRAIVSLVDKGIPLQRIRSNLETLRDRLPELDDPAAGHREVARHAEALGVELVAVGTDLYGVRPTAHPVAALGDLGPGDVVLVKASRSAGLERLVADLVNR